MAWTEQDETLGRVLVINDEPKVRRLIQLTLAKAGYAVIEAADAEEALTVLNTVEDPAIDAIICDIRLPQVNGTEAIAYFCQEFPLIPLLALTGFPDTKLAITLLKCGVLYIPKPIESDKLVNFVTRAIERRTALKA